MFGARVLGWLGCAALLACGRAPSPDARGKLAAAASATPRASADGREARAASAAATTPPATIQPPETLPASASGGQAAASSRCNEQEPQPFLVQAHFDSHHALGGTASEWKQLLERAVRYRTEQYGYVKGYGDEAWNPSTPFEQAAQVAFFGVQVSIHRRVAPALACVEAAIRERCAAHPYQPYVLSGLRRRNTYVSGEISNHVYGIALDVDPTRNPCCGCIGSWGASERCRNEKTKFERMEMPRCWVTEFERFGFYWLGHDKIEDTMHFEFLADPSRILREADVKK